MVTLHRTHVNLRSILVLMKLNPIKVRLNHLGEITKTGE